MLADVWSIARRRLAAALIVALFVAAGAAWLFHGESDAKPGPPGLSSVLAALDAPAQAMTGPLGAFEGGHEWLNSRPLAAADLRGKVVLVNFWTYSCINSLRPLPYVRAWAAKYRDRGLVVIGVHTPEFGFEKNPANVRRALAQQGVSYPVVLDNTEQIWRAFGNSAWPTFYFIGADGRVQGKVEGEGNYGQSERLIQTLLSKARREPVKDPIVAVGGVGGQAAPDWGDQRSGETYVGYAKATGVAAQGGLKPDVGTLYRPASRIPLNHWSPSGQWRVGPEFATLVGSSGAIAYRFHARDLNFVLAPAPDGRPVRFRVRVDGADPGADHGFDTDPQGRGQIRDARMYQLVRQARPVADRTFEIEFLDPGARAYVFTFG